MEEYFDSEIKRAKQELTDLKTAQQKYAGQVPLISKSVSINIPLALTGGGFLAEGKVFYKLTTTKEAFFIPSLDIYYDDVNRSDDTGWTSRWVYLQVGNISENQYLVKINAMGTNWGDNNDVWRINHGESVSIPRTLTVQCTDDFTLEAV